MVRKVDYVINIDGNWDKLEWQAIDALTINNFKGEKPKFKPRTQVKMVYDETNLYVIFRVEDRYVRSVTTEFNGPVWEDSCVEFFFSPTPTHSNNYFNLETNCGGTPLMHYNRPNKKAATISQRELEKIEMAHSLPEFVDPEIKNPITWTLEYKLPLVILSEYSNFEYPKKGVIWNGNFYKIAKNNSNPHYITWSPIGGNKPDFHQPKYFGELEFN